MSQFRGSRKHVLDWVEQRRFLPELLKLVAPVECRITQDSVWLPLGHDNPAEARLERFGPRAIRGIDWTQLASWWLKHGHGANTPNWDIALACDIDSRPGLVLVEAKANAPELSSEGKQGPREPSDNSAQNHAHIKLAIESARTDLESRLPGIKIAVDDHYQASNRIAFAWKLASLGVPTVLVYLGFLGDAGIADVGAPFVSDADWRNEFENHLCSVCPRAILDGPVSAGAAKFWVLCRSKRVLEVSPTRVQLAEAAHNIEV